MARPDMEEVAGWLLTHEATLTEALTEAQKGQYTRTRTPTFAAGILANRDEFVALLLREGAFTDDENEAMDGLCQAARAFRRICEGGDVPGDMVEIEAAIHDLQSRLCSSLASRLGVGIRPLGGFKAPTSTMGGATGG